LGAGAGSVGNCNENPARCAAVNFATGWSHTVALKTDGTVWAWGNNGNGRLGDATIIARHTPVQVSGLNGVTAVAAGHSQTVALKLDGTVWAVGRNSQGQLGDTTTTSRYTPVQTSGLSLLSACGSSMSVCNAGTGTCVAPPVANGTACNDSDACTQTDTCQSGTCTGANPVTCAAPDQCHTAGTCTTATGLCSTPTKPNGSPCDDGDATTQVDTCQAGTCTGVSVTCSTAPHTLTVSMSGGCGFTTIQAAINAAAPGDTVSVNAGTYIENLVVNKPLQLQGAGAATTTILPALSNPDSCQGSLCSGPPA